MRILWVKIGGFWPLTSGGRLRSFHIVSQISQRHRVTVMTTHATDSQTHGLAAALPACDVVSLPHAIPKRDTVGFLRALIRSWMSPLPVDLWRYRMPDLARAVRASLASGEVDVCVADFLAGTVNIPRDVPVPTVLFEHNVEHLIWKRLARVERTPWRRLLLELEWRKMRRYEVRACRRFDATVAVSGEDSAALQACAPGARVEAMATGVDPHYFSPNGTHETPGRLVFTGSMDWYPNEDAIGYFADAIWPLIRRQCPGASVTVVGRDPSARLIALANAAGIEVTGTVDDIRPHMAQAEVYVVPLRVGGGTRLKIFEALAMGKPVVSTRIGAEGLGIVPGQHFVLADHPAEFAAAVVSLLRDPGRRRILAAAGRQVVSERYSWSTVAKQFEALCTRLVRNGHAH